ncbi:alanyl-tRNA editing protein [Proteocatella sphenisci]|uniref:alanyl-tRNA editing protein n=1 Tax=Proteocatella sphenisci TaxID=181070 RepID=UPI00048E83D9|nr:alanyl-tRNA editing protein [Proteocatella sphenisci]
MSNTIKLFENSSYISKFNATVLECIEVAQGDKFHQIYEYKAILDKTAFYPEGGGQPSDRGTISIISHSPSNQKLNSKTIPVLDVHEKNGIIYHYISSPLNKNDSVECTIDWDFRFMLMQHHTGEHIVSGLINKHFGFNNVGFHMGESYVTIDIDNKLTQENLDFIENAANTTVQKNLGVKIDCPVPDELDLLNYRSKKHIDSDIRIVSVPGADMCACCGTHVKTTGEVGIIKFLSSQNYKGGTRVYMLCGKRALKDYNKKNKILYDISAQLSTKPENAHESVSQIKSERDRLKYENAALMDKIFEYRAAAIDKNLDKIILFEENLLPSDLLKFSSHLTKDRNNIVLLFSGSDERGYKYLISSSTMDIRPVADSFNDIFNAKGGGKGNCIQGTVKAHKSDILEYIEPYDFNLSPNI